MISIFQIAPNDQSMIYLGQIFGIVSPGILMPDQSSLLLGVLFKVFNTSVLSLGAGIVIYTTIVGLLKTAQEGEFLGKQWSSLWVPLRTVFGIAALFPLPTGYSAIQVIFMWIILQGVGAADTLWNTVINYNIMAGSPTKPNTSLGVMGLNKTMQGLFQGLVCQAQAKKDYGDTVAEVIPVPIKYYCHSNKDNIFCKNPLPDPLDAISQDIKVDTYKLGPNGGCGELTYCNESAICNPETKSDASAFACPICRSQKASLRKIIPVMTSIADQFVQADDDYVKAKAEQLNIYINPLSSNLKNLVIMQQNALLTSMPDVPPWLQKYCAESKGDLDIRDCIKSGPPVFATFNGNAQVPDFNSTSEEAVASLYLPYKIYPFINTDPSNSKAVDFLKPITSLYSATVNETVKQIQNQIISLPSGRSGEKWQQDAKKQGWIFAGGYFYSIVLQTKNNLNATMPILMYRGLLDAPDKSIQAYRNNFNAANILFKTINQETSTTLNSISASVPSQLADVSDSVSHTASQIISLFQFMNDSNKDNTQNNPLLSIASFGYQLMVLAQHIFWATLGAVFGAVWLLTTNFLTFGSGIPMTPWGEAAKAVIGMLSPFLILLIGGIYSTGAIMGLYVPLIPFMIFSMGAIGWLLATIEAMVAAPIVALGILSPGGQNEILGRAEPALMLLLNLFLRPALMVIGLMAGTLVSIPALKLINTAFLSSVYTFMRNTGVFEEVLLIVIYSVFVSTVVSKCFSLIYIIPERILTWIGGQAVQYGEADILQAGKQALEGGAQSIVGGGKEMGGAVTNAGTKAKQPFLTDPAKVAIKPAGAGDGGGKGQAGGGGQAGGVDKPPDAPK